MPGRQAGDRRKSSYRAGHLLRTDALPGHTAVVANLTPATAGSGRGVDGGVDRVGGGGAYVDGRRNIRVAGLPAM
ncbi:hypothetical protein [Streptomyces sp. NPDC001927]